MNRLKQSVKQAFEEEEATKKNIKELVAAMQSQLVLTQQKLAEKEKENNELLDILQKVKDLRYLENFMPNSKTIETEHKGEGDEEEESENEEEQNDINDHLYESLTATRSINPGRDSLKVNSTGQEILHEKRKTKYEDEDLGSEYNPPMSSKVKLQKKAKSRASKGPHESSNNVNQVQEHKLKPVSSKKKASTEKPTALKEQQEAHESHSMSLKSPGGVSWTKAAMAAKALNTIKKSKETIEKIQKQGEPRKKTAKSKEPLSEKLSAHDKVEVLSKMGMISEMTSVLKSFEAKIKQMQSDMSRLAAK